MHRINVHVPLALVAVAILAAIAAGCSGAGLNTGGMRLASAVQNSISSPVAPNGWALFDGSSDASVNFAPSPAPLPSAGSDALKFVVGQNDSNLTSYDEAEVDNFKYDGTKLADITALSYWTYITKDQYGQAPDLALAIDSDGNGTQDDFLVFEPAYQTGGYSGDPVPNQGAVVQNTWQKWDAFTGGWWATSAGTYGPPVYTLQTYVAAHPLATLVNYTYSSTNYGGVSVFAGGGWFDFVGYTDLVTIGVGGNSVTTDFEVTTADDCKNGGWQPLGFKNQGACVSAHKVKPSKGKTHGKHIGHQA